MTIGPPYQANAVSRSLDSNGRRTSGLVSIAVRNV
jgi:hypothetical protein